MTQMVRAYTVAKEWMHDYPNASRFDLANFLHGYDPDLDFEALTEVTRAIGSLLDKPHNW